MFTWKPLDEDQAWDYSESASGELLELLVHLCREIDAYMPSPGSSIETGSVSAKVCQLVRIAYQAGYYRGLAGSGVLYPFVNVVQSKSTRHVTSENNK